MKISVFTDLRFTAHTKPTGVGKHILQMVHGLNQIEGNCVSLLAAKDQVQHSGSLSFLPCRTMPLPWKVAEASWTLTGYPVADRWIGETDWVYCPKNDFIPVRKAHVAITVHGAHELDPNFPQPRNLSARINRVRRRIGYGRMLREASVVLTVSEFLKQQVIDWFAVAPEKIAVVGNGVEREFYAVAEQPCGGSGQPMSQPYVLCVGGLNFLDGGDRIIQVSSVLRKKAPDVKILVAGCDHDPVWLAQAAQLENLVLLGYTKSPQLSWLMRDAVALFYPTRYETFGIAAAEAMAAGTPVVTCHSTAVPEIVGNAGIFADVDNANEMAEAILVLINDSKKRDQYSRLGRERAKDYTWDACLKRLFNTLTKNSEQHKK